MDRPEPLTSRPATRQLTAEDALGRPEEPAALLCDAVDGGGAGFYDLDLCPSIGTGS